MTGPKIVTTVFFTLLVSLLSIEMASAGVSHQVAPNEAKADQKFWTPKRTSEAINRDPLFGRQGQAKAQSDRGLRHRPVRNYRSEVGRILGSDSTGGFSCSGTSIETRSLRLVLTAAHCLYYQGKWAKNVVFIPGYRDGLEPHGSYTAKAFWVPNRWPRLAYGTIGANFDVGIIVTRDRSDGSRLGENVGSLPIEPYPTRGGVTNVIGYPAAAMRGRFQRTCRNYTSWWRESRILPGPQGWRVRCNMAGGSSGGPWLSPYENSQGGQTMKVDGITSTGFSSGNRNFLTSPYLGKRLVRLIRATEGKLRGR